VYGTDEDQARSLDALRDAAPWLRRRLGERLQIRHVPQLSVRRDESIESGDRVLRILRELEDEREGQAE
jgi:ribosome-binding factor A